MKRMPGGLKREEAIWNLQTPKDELVHLERLLVLLKDTLAVILQGSMATREVLIS